MQGRNIDCNLDCIRGGRGPSFFSNGAPPLMVGTHILAIQLLKIGEFKSQGR